MKMTQCYTAFTSLKLQAEQVEESRSHERCSETTQEATPSSPKPPRAESDKSKLVATEPGERLIKFFVVVMV